MFDRPLYRDWIVWLGVVGVVSGLSYTSHNGPANIVDYLIAIGVQWLLWAMVPAAIRQGIRNRRRV